MRGHRSRRPPKFIRKGAALNKNAFSRAKAKEAEIEAARMAGNGAEFDVTPYRSRGKGGKHGTRNRTILGRWNRSRSKYMPHQGEREIARRAGHVGIGGVGESARFLDFTFHHAESA